MPWRSYAERDAAVLEFKDAVARGEHRTGCDYRDATVDGHLACAIGWAAHALGINVELRRDMLWAFANAAEEMGLTSYEMERIYEANDIDGPEAAIAAMLAVPVGGEE